MYMDFFGAKDVAGDGDGIKRKDGDDVKRKTAMESREKTEEG